ncbi:MAG: Crp/Fnr family transcriptional regulator [Chloroflexota bacterium]|nr:Crp/Fnr family transcriptional regulator [Chloroflexota bacterium]
MSVPDAATNDILARVSERELSSIGRRVALDPGDVLHRFGDSTDRYLFPLSGMISLTVPTPDGHNVEVAIVGREGVCGVARLLGDDRADLEAISQVRGEAIEVPVQSVRGELERSLRTLGSRYVTALFIELAQTAACNRLHTVEQRTARWLLHAAERAQTSDLQLTHEFLAMMLAVRRASVTVVVGEFERAGLINAERGRISLADGDGLSECACECYNVIRAAAPRYD